MASEPDARPPTELAGKGEGVAATTAANPGSGLMLGVRRKLATAFYGSPFYNLLLRGRHPHGLEVIPTDPWPGDADEADALFQGRYHFAGENYNAPNAAPWQAFENGMSEAWAQELHGFSWIRHFAARGGEAAKRQTQALVDSWVRHYAHWDAFAWRPDIVGRRLISWASHGDFIILNAELTYRSRVLDSMARQARHLARAVLLAPSGAPKLTAIIGLAFAGLTLPDSRRRLNTALRLLERELAVQILADGGHFSRNPSLHMAVLQDLVALRAALIEADHDVPQGLQNTIDRMAPMLRFFRHSDGGLALFNGSREQGDGTVDITLAAADSRGKPLSSAPHTGFDRLTRNRLTVLVDSGSPAPSIAGVHPHAGTLSFEMSVGKHRVVVNCGAPEQSQGEWGAAVRATAAHSTLTVGETSQFDISAGPEKAASVSRHREEADGSTLLDTQHEQYRDRFNLDHRRRLFLDETGNGVRGEDTLVAVTPDRKRRRSDSHETIPFALRFHLHPAVSANQQANGGVLLKLPGGGGWRFLAAGGDVSVEDSIYLGSGEARRCHQIVVSGLFDKDKDNGETVVKWALHRAVSEAEPGSEPTLPGLDL